MRDVVWRLGLSLMALTFLVILGPSISCGIANRLIEQVTGQTPQAQIFGYLDLIASGDRQAAVALWVVHDQPGSDLEARRESITDELLAFGRNLDHQVLDIVWWRTCCEPAVIDDPTEAGGARVRVAVHTAGRERGIYVFDLLVPGGYWGSAMNNPPRKWAIVDVYRQGQVPLVWTIEVSDR